MEKIKIVLVEDDLSYQILVKQTIDRTEDLEMCEMCKNEKEAISAIEKFEPQIVLMDLNLESTWMDGVELARKIRLNYDTKVIILTAFDSKDVTVKACTQAFASAYVIKYQSSLLVPTIQATISGVTPQSMFIYASILGQLTLAEKTVLDIIMGDDIELHSAKKTVLNQRGSILKKLNLQNIDQLKHIFSVYF